MLKGLFSFIFSSPVTVLASVVSVICVGILLVKIAPFSPSIGDDSESKAAILQSTESTLQEDAGSVSSSRKDSSTEVSKSSNKSVFKQKRKASHVSNQGNDDDNNFVDGNEYLPIDNEQVPLNDDIAPSINTYSDFDSSKNTSSTSTSTSTTSTTIDPSDANNLDDGSKVPTPLKDFPSLHTPPVKIDADETHYISCRPIVAGGRSCMCEYTVVDAVRTISWVEDNCG